MSTYSSLHYHITFSTKLRAPLIHQSWETRLHEYLGGTVKKLGGFPQGVGGVEDHVHLLVGLKPTHHISDFLRELKKSASLWIRTNIELPDSSGKTAMGFLPLAQPIEQKFKLTLPINVNIIE